MERDPNSLLAELHGLVSAIESSAREGDASGLKIRRKVLDAWVRQLLLHQPSTGGAEGEAAELRQKLRASGFVRSRTLLLPGASQPFSRAMRPKSLPSTAKAADQTMVCQPRAARTASISRAFGKSAGSKRSGREPKPNLPGVQGRSNK